MSDTSGTIVVRLSRNYFGDAITHVDDIRSLAQAKAPQLSQVLTEYERLPASRLVRCLHAPELDRFERHTTADGNFPSRSLTTYWRIDASSVAADDRSRLMGRLLEVRSAAPEVVREVYELPRGSDPTVTTGGAFVHLQRYLEAAPNGIDALWAWRRPGGDGSHVRFVDVEQGWMHHEDLPHLERLLPDTQLAADGAHGTAVIGIVAGLHNGKGIMGIASRPKLVGIASHVIDGEPGNIHDAILNLIGAGKTTPDDVPLQPGDVLLIEWQVTVGDTHDLPAELASHSWSAISTATRKGIVVVECAGNGDHSLDDFREIARGESTTDSGGIIVGACRAELEVDQADPSKRGHRRWNPVPGTVGSNYGSRVDCHAFGEQLVTAGPTFRAKSGLPLSLIPAGVAPLTPRVPPERAYRSDFSGTSGAGAVIAGAAVVLQSMYIAAHDEPASPRDIRRALSKVGTPQLNRNQDPIGVMPDLRKAAEELGLVPPDAH